MLAIGLSFLFCTKIQASLAMHGCNSCEKKSNAIKRRRTPFTNKAVLLRPIYMTLKECAKCSWISFKWFLSNFLVSPRQDTRYEISDGMSGCKCSTANQNGPQTFLFHPHHCTARKAQLGTCKQLILILNVIKTPVLVIPAN